MPNITFTPIHLLQMNQSRVRPFSPSLLTFLATPLFLTVARDRAPCAAASGSTLFHVLHDGWDISSLYSSVRCEKKNKNKKNKKPCRSAKTKLTCDLWYQARSKAGMTGWGGANWPCQTPPPH